MSIVMTREELEEFLIAAEERFGDPAEAVCLLSLRWCEGPVIAPDMVIRPHGPDVLLLELVDADGTQAFPLELSADGPGFRRLIDGVMVIFHPRKICAGVWTLNPSLNVTGQFHGFVVIHDVPDPAPWERLVVLATSF